MGKVEELKKAILAPFDLVENNKGLYSDPEVNTEYIMPRQFLHRLQKIMDEYAGGVTSAFKTSKALLDRGLELMGMLRRIQTNRQLATSMSSCGFGRTSRGCGLQSPISAPCSSGRRPGGQVTISGPIRQRWMMRIGSALSIAVGIPIAVNGRCRKRTFGPCLVFKL
jgi:hypothetical protein